MEIWGKDKLWHIVAGFVIGLLGGFIMANTGVLYGQAVVCGILCALVAGVTKEIADALYTGAWDVFDLTYTVIAGVAGACVGSLVSYLI